MPGWMFDFEALQGLMDIEYSINVILICPIRHHGGLNSCIRIILMEYEFYGAS